MEFEITLGQEDWKTYQKYVQRELPKRVKTWADKTWVNILIWMVIGLIFITVNKRLYEFHWPTAISVGILFVIIISLTALHIIKVQKAFEPMEEGTFCGTHKFKFSDNGLATSGDGYESFHSWKVVKRIERSDGLIFLFVDTVYAFIIPEAKVEDPEALYSLVSRYWRVAKE